MDTKDYKVIQDKKEVILVAVNRDLEEFIVPVGITMIGKNCFSISGNLKKVVLSNTVKGICSDAFAYSRIESVVLNDKLRWIEPNCFRGCSKLKSITIPGSVMILPKNCFNGSNIKEIILNEGVEYIEESCFQHCSKLEHIHLPDTVRLIAEHAFDNCSSLKNLYIPKSVHRIHRLAFYEANVSSVIEVSKENPIYNSFDNSNAIIESSSGMLILGNNHTVFNNSISIIGEAAFYHTHMHKLEINNRINHIESYALNNCTFDEVYIGSNLKKFSRNAFYCCDIKQKIEVSKNNQVYDSREDCNAIIDTEQNSLVYATYCSKIPSTITHIDAYAFSELHMHQLKIPDSIKKLSRCAFYNCSIDELYIGNGITQLQDCFKNTNINTVVLSDSSKIKNYNDLLSMVNHIVMNKNMYMPATLNLFKYGIHFCNIFTSMDSMSAYKDLLDKNYHIVDVDMNKNYDLLTYFENLYQANSNNMKAKEHNKVLCIDVKLANTSFTYLKAYSVIGYMLSSEFYDKEDIDNLLRDTNLDLINIYIRNDMINPICDYMLKHHLLTDISTSLLLEYYQEIHDVERITMLLEFSNKDVSINVFIEDL